MRSIRVPLPHRESIRRLARIADSEFGQLIAALSAPEENIARARMCAAISASLNLKDGGAAAIFLDALLGAHSVLQRRDATPSEVSEAIASDSLLKLEEAERNLLAARLESILGIELLAALSRAATLLADEPTFCRARTLSDVRPVFLSRSNPPVAVGAVIRHTLQIRYHPDGPETEPFFIGVDTSGLKSLRDAIDRALAKDSVLREMAEGCGLRIIDVEESH
jgi:hypothetical protein